MMVVKLNKPVLIYFLMGWNISPSEYEDLPYTLFPLKISRMTPAVNSVQLNLGDFSYAA